MERVTEAQVHGQVLDVLKFMARHVQNRPLLFGLISADIERWDEISIREKQAVFRRDVRRFSAACPTLARKDRVRHAFEALDTVAGEV